MCIRDREEVFEELKEDPSFAEYTMIQCQQDLAALASWGNLDVYKRQDLDGTLTESGEGITKSVQYALEKLGKPCLLYTSQSRSIKFPEEPRSFSF